MQTRRQQVPTEPGLACFQNSILLPPHTAPAPHWSSRPVCPTHSALGRALGGSSSRGLLLLILFRKPIQKVLVGTVGQTGGSMGDETGPGLGEG